MGSKFWTSGINEGRRMPVPPYLFTPELGTRQVAGWGTSTLPQYVSPLFLTGSLQWVLAHPSPSSSALGVMKKGALSHLPALPTCPGSRDYVTGPSSIYENHNLRMRGCVQSSLRRGRSLHCYRQTPIHHT